MTDSVPAKAITEPLDRSSRPEMISIVSPKASMVVTEICLEMLVRLPQVRKLLLSSEQMTNSTTSTRNIAYLLLIVSQRFALPCFACIRRSSPYIICQPRSVPMA